MADYLHGCAVARESNAGEPLRACGITEASIRQLLPRSGGTAGGDIDPDALRAIGIDCEGVRAVVDRTFGEDSLDTAPDRRSSSARLRKPPFAPQAKRSIQLALRVAIELHDHHMEPGHLLESRRVCSDSTTISSQASFNSPVPQSQVSPLPSSNGSTPPRSWPRREQTFGLSGRDQARWHTHVR